MVKIPITNEPHDYNCPFCNLIAGKSDEYNSPQDIVCENDQALAFVTPKWWLKNPGHVMVIPKQHFQDIYDIPDEILAAVQSMGKRIAIALKQAYECDGTSFRQHNELHGNQEVWHYHLHVFPRYENDNLYANHDQTRWVSSAEKQPYVQKLRKALEQES